MILRWALVMASLVSLSLTGRRFIIDLQNLSENSVSIIWLLKQYWFFGTVLIATLLSWYFAWRQRRSEDDAYAEINILHGPYGIDMIRDMGQTTLEASKGKQKIAIYGLEAGWTDNDLNAALATADLNNRSIGFGVIPSVWKAYESQDKNLNSRLNQKMRFALRRKLKNGTRLTNDDKIRLAGDVSATPGATIQVQKTDYLSSLMTDQLAFLRVYQKSDDKMELNHGTEDFVKVENGKLRLASISEADNISNQIGASTIAFTKDGLITIVYQTKQNAQSQDRLAPSGSGSLDWDDTGSDRTASFLEVVKRGAARELIEECGLVDQVDPEKFLAQSMHIYGFARMVHRAGKPEFFCVAAIPFTSTEINSFQVDKKEIPFTAKTINGELPKLDWDDNLAQNIPKICRFYSNPVNRDILISNTKALGLSYPLRHGLDMLADVMEENPEIANRLAKALMASHNLPLDDIS